MARRVKNKKIITKNQLVNQLIERALKEGELNDSLIRFCIRKAKNEGLKSWLYVASEIAKNNHRKISQNVIDSLVKTWMEIDLEKAIEIAPLGASKETIQKLIHLCIRKRFQDLEKISQLQNLIRI